MKKPICNCCPLAPHLTTLSAKILLACMLVWLAMASLAIAQDVQSATVVGTVTDPTGAVVPNATVTLTNTATNVAAHATTNAEGAYYIPFQPAGTYTLTIDGTGFKKYVQIGIVLEIGQTPRFDVRMDVGTTSQTVEVTALAERWTRKSSTTFRWSRPSHSTSCFTPRDRRQITTAHITFWGYLRIRSTSPSTEAL
jgi:hypothetical protein